MRPFARLVWVALLLVVPARAQNVTVTILHTNDVHSHAEPVTIGGAEYGGYARHVSLVRRFRETDPNPILVSAGDLFQGTLYFRTYDGLADLFFHRLIGYDAIALGNHEFDLGPAALGSLLDGMGTPILAANLDVSAEPGLAAVVKPHTVLEVGGTRIGLIGAMTPDLPTISNIGETVRMLDLVASIQKSVDALLAEGVDKIVLVAHVGYLPELELAGKVRGLDVIVGGHSHTFLGEIGIPGMLPSLGPYPTVVEHEDGERTLLVTAGCWGVVLGRIQVVFDQEGRVLEWLEARPVVADASVPEDEVALAALRAFGRPIEAAKAREVYRSETGIETGGPAMFVGESPMANTIADAMLEAGRKAGATLAIMNAGGVRSPLPAGSVSYARAVEILPFANTLVLLDLTGAELLRALEHGVSHAGAGAFPHVSRGTAYRYDPARPTGSRLVEATVGGEPVDPAKTYRVVLNSFTAKGGDGFEAFRDAKGERIDTGAIDLDALLAYLAAHPELPGTVEGRIAVVGQ